MNLNSYGKRFRNTHEIKIITTNTKTRRLGYLRLLASLFEKRRSFPRSILSLELEEYCSNYITSLEKYQNSKGVIKITKKGTSALPYIKLADDLGLLHITNNQYSPSKSFSVFIACKKLWSENNVFKLSKLDRLFFFENIFNNDFFFNRLVIEMIYNEGVGSYLELKENFHQYTLSKINQLNDEINSRELIKNNLKLRDRIKKWEKPQVYLEHVLMPRLNWMFDLSLINIDKNSSLHKTMEGTIFVDLIKKWDQKNGSMIANCQEYFEVGLMEFFTEIYSLEKKKFELTPNSNALFVPLIEESFDKFKTFAPNRVTLSQTIDYLKYNIYVNHNILIEYEEIKRQIKNQLEDSYLFRYLPKQNDGYLQKK